MDRLRIAALLPHVEVFGGVRRYLELGNALSALGHEFVLFHPRGTPADWLPCRFVARPFRDLEAERFDVGLCGEYSIIPDFERLPARTKYFYFVLEGHRDESRIARRPDFRFLGNSEGMCRRIERKYGVRCERAPGGVNPEIFHPQEEPPRRDTFNILCYGRIYKKRKGVRQVVRAVEALSSRHTNLRLVLFDTQVGLDRRDPRPLIRTHVPLDFHLNLPQDRMAWLYGQADLFVSAERRAGWANTCAEAMACGVPVVCTPSGTRDFAEDGRTALVAPRPWTFLLRRRIDRLIRDEALRDRLARAGRERIRSFTWTALADRLTAIFLENQGDTKNL